MNKLVYIAIIAICVFQIKADDPPIPGYKCPLEDIRKGCKGPTDCLYRDDCTHFVQCTAGGYAYLKHCPSGLFWNDNKKICDRTPCPSRDQNDHVQAIDPVVWRTFIQEVQTGERQVLTGEQNLKADIALHPENRFQHKTYCDQLITMIDNIRIKIDEFGRAYPGLMDAPQASAWAHEGSMTVFIMSDLKQLYKSI